MRLPISEPVVFEGFTGWFQAAAGHTGGGPPVLMFSPFGYEELCGRPFWTTLADRLALAGIESLRFDYPGTGNALDGPCDGIDDWRTASVALAGELRRRTGQTHIAVLGQGLGATLCLSWAAELGPLAAMVLLEPAMSGRAYLRGLTAWGASVAAASGLVLDPAEARCHAVAGFGLAEARIPAVRALDLGAGELPPMGALLVLEQPGGTAGKRLETRLGGAGVPVTRGDFPGYADLLTDPTAARVPEAAVATVVDWLSARLATPAGDAVGAPRHRSCLVDQAFLEGDRFRERPVRFGPSNALAGVLCLPTEAGGAEGRGMVFVNAGRDHSIGWARSAVTQARALAREGVASLRFDPGGIGDSRATPGSEAEILYSDGMCDDLRAAVDHLHGLGYRALGLVGRCSGAWAAFTVAVEDPRIQTVALVNTGYFLWDKTKSLADVIRFSQRNVGDLGATLLRRDGLRRLLKGHLDLRGAWRFLLRQANRRVLRRCAPLLGRLTAESRRYHDLHERFTTLRARGTRVLLAYSEGDSSIDELRSFMGSDLARLRRYPNVSRCTVLGADHNVTPPAARADMLARLMHFLRPADVVVEQAPTPMMPQVSTRRIALPYVRTWRQL